jgi:FAD:protein FMN transferase
VRRCRPLLGTFVEITASGLDGAALASAVDAAFAAIERIQDLLSAYDPASELSLLNCEAAAHAVSVSLETFAVLRLAHRMATESGGAFDYTIAPTLAEWGLRPANLYRRNPGNWRHVRLLPGRNVLFLRPLTLDLGGIAKGFAVDAAIEVLRRHAVESAVVNAGGDLRVFGPQPTAIHLRHPAQPQTFAHTINLQHCAVATSSPCFTECTWHGQRVSHLVNSLQTTAITGQVSATVRARECWLADALTKVVLNAPRRAEKLLAQYEAEAFMLTA